MKLQASVLPSRGHICRTRQNPIGKAMHARAVSTSALLQHTESTYVAFNWMCWQCVVHMTCYHQWGFNFSGIILHLPRVPPCPLSKCRLNEVFFFNIWPSWCFFRRGGLQVEVCISFRAFPFAAAVDYCVYVVFYLFSWAVAKFMCLFVPVWIETYIFMWKMRNCILER